MTRQFDVRVGAYAVILREGKVLLAHWNEHGNSCWTLPGGGLELLEDAPTAAVREVMEETGYAAVLDGLLGVDSLFIPAEDRLRGEGLPLHALRVIYRAHVAGGSLRHEQGGSTDQAAWVPLEDLDSLATTTLVPIGLKLAAAGEVPDGQVPSAGP